MSDVCPVNLEVYGVADLTYDFGLAEAVEAAARGAISALDGQGPARASYVTTAREDFSGRFSELFAANAEIASNDRAELVTRLRDVVAFMGKLSQAAREENARRRSAREWQQRVEARRANWVDATWDNIFGEEPPPRAGEVSPPSFDASSVPVGKRDTPAPGAGGGGGGTSSARPSNLRSFATGTAELDAALAQHPGRLSGAASDFLATCDFGRVDVEPVVAGFRAWLAANGNDVGWANTIAAAFESAGAGGGIGTLSDVSLAAALAAAGVNAERADLTIDPPTAIGAAPTTGFANDPVNTSTGNFLEPEVDVACGGAAASLRFTRMYNSLDPSGGVFGRGWSSILDVRLVHSDEAVRFVQADGRQIVFPREGEGWGRGAGENFWVEREPVELLAELGAPARQDLAELLVVRDNHGGWWAFTPAGLWLGAGRGTGTAIFATRDDIDRVVRLTHERGRFIDVEYVGEQVAVVSASDGARVEYLYDDAVRLVGVREGVGTRRYRWNDAGYIDQVVSARGVVECENAYDAQGRVVGQLTSFGRRTRFAYLPGRVTEISDVAGEHANTWIADRKGRLIGVVDADGKRQSMAYDAHGNVVSVTERDGQITVHAFDARGRKLRTVTPEGADITYGYDEQDRVTTVVTASGGAVEYRYADDTDRNPCQVTDPGGGLTALTWQDGLLTRAVDPEGVQVSFEYDTFGDLVGVVNAIGATARFVRDQAGRVVEAITPSGSRTRFRYDGHGLLVAREGADGAVWRYEHGPGGVLRAMIDPLGARTVFEYGAHGELVRTMDPLGRAVVKDFDEFGNVASVTLPDGAEWAFAHDALSRLREITDPAGGVWSREYDVTGQLAATTDPTGVRTDITRSRATGVETVRGAFEESTVRRDEFGRPTRIEQADGSAELITYDACGRPVELLDADGGLTRIERDLAGRVVQITTPAGRVSRYEYDSCGRPSAAIDAVGARTTLTYDADSRVVSRTLPTGDVVTLEYDQAGRVVRERVPGVGVSRYRFDKAGRLTGVQDTRYGKRSFQYDAAGQLVAAINGLGGITRYVYDERGRMVTITDPLGGVTTRTYTSLDKVASSSDPLGRVTTATYDPAGRQVSQTDPDGNTTQWEYDDAGLESGMRVGGRHVSSIVRDVRARTATITDHTRESAEVRHTLRYSRLGQLVHRSTDDGAEVSETRWEYDADGLRTGLVAPDGTRVDTQRDAAGRVTKVVHGTFGEARYTYDLSGRVTQARAGDAVQTWETLQTWEYQDGYPVRHARTDASGTEITRIGRDADGRIQQIDDANGVTRYAYDEACQLVGATQSRGAARQGGAESGVAGSAGAGSSWVYDVAGRLVAESVGGAERSFEYDRASQLLRTTSAAGETTYAYDGQGRRIESVSDGARTRYVWDGRGWLAQVVEHGPAGTRETSVWVSALGELADVDGTRIDWDTAAGVPSPLRVGDTNVFRGPAGVTGVGDGWAGSGWRSTRATDADDPWQVLAGIESAGAAGVGGGGSGAADSAGQVGSLASAGSAAGVTVASDGSIGVAGLEWMGARAYDPAARGFLSVDPLAPVTGTAGGSNPYSYAGNDPLHAVDPLGLRPVTDAELQAYASERRGSLVDVAETAGQWWSENWEFVAGGAAVVAGAVLIATGVGGPLGIALIAAGADTIIQKATTGEVNWGQVAVSGALGLIPGAGLAGSLLTHAGGNAVEGAVENVAQYAVSGQPVTPAGLLSNAATGAVVSAATGGVLSKINVPTSAAKLGVLEASTPPANILPSSERIFVTTSSGTTYDVPSDWVLREADNKQGIIAQNPASIGVGNGNANMIRIMDPTARNPEGYSRYSNDVGQWLDPMSGKPGPNSATHISATYEGVYAGWPN